MLYGALATFGLPLASILAGAAAGAAVTGTDSGTLAGALLALGVVLAGFRLVRHRLEQALLKSLRVPPRT
jgi:hypothetical protein